MIVVAVDVVGVVAVDGFGLQYFSTTGEEFVAHAAGHCTLSGWI